MKFSINNNTHEIVNSAIDLCKKHILENYADKIEALVLIGSFSRGEGIVVNRPDDKEVVFISDIEFMIILKPGEFNYARNFLNAEQIQEKLKASGFNVDISFGATTRKHLKKYKPCIFTIEMKKFGKVLWGNMVILDNIPDYSEQDIPALDGFILLNNRIVEQLKLLKMILLSQDVCGYSFDKGYVQIVNSFLVLRKSIKVYI